MFTPSTFLTFPHPSLTLITGRSTNKLIQQLQKKLYANACAIHSTCGGEVNGHLALFMADTDYLARATVAFDSPVHPGAAPVHAVGATAARISDTNRQFQHDLSVHTQFITVKKVLKKQILEAVDRRFLAILENIDFGFADVFPQQMLAHLKLTYGEIINEDIDANCAGLLADGDADNPIEDLWLRITEAQRYADRANKPISNTTAIRFTLQVLECTNLYITACKNWCLKPTDDQTMPNFQTHFTRAHCEQMRKLTAQMAGYHGTHAATASLPNTASTSSLAPPSLDNDTLPPETALSGLFITSVMIPSILVDNTRMYYFWSHSLGKNRGHMSVTCNNKKDGHIDMAMVENMQDGCDKIMKPRGHS